MERTYQPVENKLREAKEVDLKHFIAFMSIKFGIRGKSLKGCLKDLEAVGRMKTNDGPIKWGCGQKRQDKFLSHSQKRYH